MDINIIHNLATGFGAALSLQNLWFALVGCMLGTLIGVLPGIGPIPTIAMLLPVTFGLDPLSSLIMLAGIYYGAQYGGSTTSILVNMPGEASSIVTTLDGHPMAKQGRAGAALSVAALGSFFAGCVGTIFIAAFGPVLAGLAQEFNSPDYFSLMVLGLVMAVVLAHGSVVKAIGMVLIGLLLGLVGTDVNSGVTRYTFGISEIWDGIDFLPLVIGLFGIVEVIRNLEQHDEHRVPISTKIRDLWPSKKDFQQSWPAVLRGTALGSVLGILPGGGAVLASFASYTMEKKIAKDPSRFGKGAIEGVAGPESANNAASQTSFIPLLTLGLPSNAIMAIMMGAMIIHGIQPGSAVMTKHPELFWGMVASMWIGNAMLVIINLPLVGIWVKLLAVPYHILYPMIMSLICIGAYSISNNPFDVMVVAGLGVMGYLLRVLQMPAAPLLIGFVLGPLLEEYLRRAMLLSRGDFMTFIVNPISGTMFAITGMLILWALYATILGRKKRLVEVEHLSVDAPKVS